MVFAPIVACVADCADAGEVENFVLSESCFKYVSAIAVPTNCAAPPVRKATRIAARNWGASSATSSMCGPNMTPRIATPSVAPIIRPTLTKPDDMPERSAGTLATATVAIGPVINPSPMPIANSAAAMIGDRSTQARKARPRSGTFQLR